MSDIKTKLETSVAEFQEVINAAIEHKKVTKIEYTLDWKTIIESSDDDKCKVTKAVPYIKLKIKKEL